MIRTAVLTISDGVAAGTREDRSGAALVARLGELSWSVDDRHVVPDETHAISTLLAALTASGSIDVVITTGGTGVGPRDVTPEAASTVADREIPGFGELMRSEGLKKTRFAPLSRSAAYTRGKALILTLPGSPKGALESLDAVAYLVTHVVDLLHGRTEHHANFAKPWNHRRKRSISLNMRTAAVLFTAATLFTAAALLAQQPQPQGASSTEGSAVIPGVTVRVVMAPVTVTTKDGTVVNNLQPSDFRLYDNNKLQRVTEDVTEHALSVVVVVQANSQVEKILPQIQKIGSLLQAQVLGDEGEAAIMMFDHRIQTLQDFTSDGDKITAALKKLKPGSSTSKLNDATIEAITKLKSRPVSRRRALLLISESRDNGSDLRAREVLSAAEFSNVVIYSVNMSHLVAAFTEPPPAGRSVLDNRPPGAVHLPGGQVETPTTQSQANLGNWTPVIREIMIAAKAVFVKNPLEIYTTYSGGREYNFKTQRDLDRAISDLGEELHSQYLLTYTPNNQEEPGYHNIVVQVSKPDMKVRTRDGYYLAGTPEGAKK